MSERETTIEDAAALLRAAGWIVAPPALEKLPTPEAGQVWVSPKRGVEPRTVIRTEPVRWAMHVPGVSFTTPTRPPGKYGPAQLTTKAWEAWVKKAGARPA